MSGAFHRDADAKQMVVERNGEEEGVYLDEFFR